MSQCCLKTPIGWLLLTESSQQLTAIEFLPEAPAALLTASAGILQEASRQLAEYFAGQRKSFTLPYAMQGTRWQRSVWQALTRIPYGETRSYRQIAEQVGNPRAFRAVGMANNRNPLPILVPCHRVIGADGSLVGYASGVEIKQKLLQLEQRYSL